MNVFHNATVRLAAASLVALSIAYLGSRWYFSSRSRPHPPQAAEPASENEVRIRRRGVRTASLVDARATRRVTPDEVSAGGMRVCPELNLDLIPDETLARTRWKTRGALREYLVDAGGAFNALRRSAVGRLIQALGEAQTCYSQASDAPTIGHLAVYIRATTAKAAVTKIELIRTTGADSEKPIVQECLARFSARSLPIEVAADAGSPFAAYDDYYPNEVRVPFGRSWETLASSLRAGFPARP